MDNIVLGTAASLIDLVFSWSIQDALNPILYKGQIKKIPTTFTSTAHYYSSFVAPLVEETHADLLSAMSRLSRAPSYQLHSIESETNYRAPTDFSYKIVLRKPGNSNQTDVVTYKPQAGDLAALTDVKPTCISDLNRPKMPYILAYVQSVDDGKLSVRSSKPIMIEQDMQRNKHIDLFFVFLTNLTTNVRIWNALHPNPILADLPIINKVIQMNDEKECAVCLSENDSVMIPSIKSYNLNDSQEAAITSCIKTWRCNHQSGHVKLIWGPPGTGKTKTVGLLLLVLLRMKCRAITCAPTLIAVMELASRVMRLVSGTLDYETYGLGDIVLFGSSERMGMDDHENLRHVFLDYRVEMLKKCFSPSTGWNASLTSMIDFLEDPRGQYGRYVTHRELGINQDEMDDPLTLEGFIKKRFFQYNEQLKFCVVNLCTHLPTARISLQVVTDMMVALDLLRSIETLLNRYDYGDERLSTATKTCLPVLESLARSFRVPEYIHKFLIKNLCLDNAYLLFCTASSSSKLHTERTQELDLLIIDEAAQLKECESTIPFQLPGLRQVVLVGDERQLPAMIRSRISGEAEFGRSMFERLVLLGEKKHLFNVQYRMHPAISSFPNKEFYDGLIMDAPMVKHRSHEKDFLHGNMYGAYSFINIAYGKEQFSHLSKMNMVEVAVVCSIVGILFKEFNATKQRVSIGVISPYTAQVHAIEEKLKQTYSGSCFSSDSGFRIKVRSVDGFQGGEEDVLIISTVRSNLNGAVGFLSNRQRANVSLTRGRHCLWILGNETTFIKSNSVWTKLVLDAKTRGCFFNAHEDKHLNEAITTTLIDLQQFDILLTMDSPLFKHAKWKICFSKDLKKSMSNIKNKEVHKQTIKVMEKLASGWHDDEKKKMIVGHDDGCCFGLLQVSLIGDGELSLVWSVELETVKGNSEWVIQVLKVWDVLPLLDVAKVAQKLHILFAEYTVEKISRCRYRCTEGNLVVPMKWVVEDNPIEGHEDDKMQCLSTSGDAHSNVVEDNPIEGHEDDKMQCLSTSGDVHSNLNPNVVEDNPIEGHEDDKMQEKEGSNGPRPSLVGLYHTVNRKT
ncbi:putative ATP-dependent helicase C29A10.10c-like [Gossypium australe]|uniref:Putative ATP-dependent helicase C29A10.10c-like n=1 Tax=Gossypium australe TaxID=47621 RepID=A0A5B6VHG7_9ROSI|nr:putative ATP-dependent helicase C29A10.10c-like [Gossypium australe]